MGFCSKCGALSGPDSDFCKKCGAALMGIQPKKENETKTGLVEFNSPFAGLKWLVIGVPMGVIILIGLAGVYLYFSYYADPVVGCWHQSMEFGSEINAKFNSDHTCYFEVGRTVSCTWQRGSNGIELWWTGQSVMPQTAVQKGNTLELQVNGYGGVQAIQLVKVDCR